MKIFGYSLVGKGVLMAGLGCAELWQADRFPATVCDMSVLLIIGLCLIKKQKT